MSWRKKLAELNATPDEPLTPVEEAFLVAYRMGGEAQKQRGAVANAARSNAFQYGNQKAAGLEWLDERYLINPVNPVNPGGKMLHVETKAVHTLEHVYGELMSAFKVSRDTAKNWVTEWRKPFLSYQQAMSLKNG